MAKKKTHLAQALHNEQLCSFLEDTPYSDWRVTSTFYAALHYIEAYLDTLKPPIHCRIHVERDRVIANFPVTNALYNDYRNLKDLSAEARYSGQKLSSPEIKADVIPSLEKIKKQLKQYF